MEKNGKITEQYEMKNSEESWNKFVGKYILEMPEIALEASTSGKHVARILRNSKGFRFFSPHCRSKETSIDIQIIKKE